MPITHLLYKFSYPKKHLLCDSFRFGALSISCMSKRYEIESKIENEKKSLDDFERFMCFLCFYFILFFISISIVVLCKSTDTAV